MIIGALLIGVIMLLVGLGFLASRRSQYQAARHLRESAQALTLAESGLEDARVKMLKLYDFPPWLEGQTTFAYAEQLTTGSYQVSLERVANDNLEDGLYRVTSVGLVGPANSPSARAVVEAEMVLPGVVATFRDGGGF
ncbi:MAG: hypothetical protein AB7S38_23770 [Vulcanimicrobiota bacterium]